jgi:putative PIN family toxin of toxin-antitoxin system
LAGHLPSKTLTACLDANVFISAFAFGGVPSEVVDGLLSGDFRHVTSAHLLEEVRRNLAGKLKLDENEVGLFIDFIEDTSSILKPSGQLKAISYNPDNVILELAVIGGCDVLVTGDKKHLLPLNPFRGVVIEPPSQFLKRLRSLTR